MGLIRIPYHIYLLTVRISEPCFVIMAYIRNSNEAHLSFKMCIIIATLEAIMAKQDLNGAFPTSEAIMAKQDLNGAFPNRIRMPLGSVETEQRGCC